MSIQGFLTKPLPSSQAISGPPPQDRSCPSSCASRRARRLWQGLAMSTAARTSVIASLIRRARRRGTPIGAALARFAKAWRVQLLDLPWFGSILAGTQPAMNVTPNWLARDFDQPAADPCRARMISSSAPADATVMSWAVPQTKVSRDKAPPENWWRSVLGILGRFSTGNPAEHAADGHANAAGVTLAQHIAGHDLAGREHVC
jgi:hypothetical protein